MFWCLCVKCRRGTCRLGNASTRNTGALHIQLWASHESLRCVTMVAVRTGDAPRRLPRSLLSACNHRCGIWSVAVSRSVKLPVNVSSMIEQGETREVHVLLCISFVYAVCKFSSGKLLTDSLILSRLLYLRGYTKRYVSLRCGAPRSHAISTAVLQKFYAVSWKYCVPPFHTSPPLRLLLQSATQ